jgi:hypothetical protein
MAEKAETLLKLLKGIAFKSLTLLHIERKRTENKF